MPLVELTQREANGLWSLMDAMSPDSYCWTARVRDAAENAVGFEFLDYDPELDYDEEGDHAVRAVLTGGTPGGEVSVYIGEDDIERIKNGEI